MNEFLKVCQDLEAGKIRVAEKVDGEWKVNSWIKEMILTGFRLGKLTDMSEGGLSFIDKDTIPARRFTVESLAEVLSGGEPICPLP